MVAISVIVGLILGNIFNVGQVSANGVKATVVEGGRKIREVKI